MDKFNFDTVQDFDGHISSSITGYDLLHSLIVNISSFFIKPNTVPVDLGCTTGKLLLLISDKYDVSAIGYDITSKNFQKGTNQKVSLLEQDITEDGFDIPVTDLILSVFTLQFLDINDRLPLLKKCYKSLNRNGALIVCEKEIAKDGAVQEVFTFSNYDNKRLKFTEKEILEKEVKLRHTMTNLRADENMGMFRQAGFKVIEPFFQSLNFKGYILRK